MVLSVLTDAIVASISREYGPVPSIRLDGNGLELIDADLTPMAASLRSLSLAGNRLRDVRPLAALTGLEELDLADNEIHDIEPLCSLSNLNVLDLSNNALVDSGGLFGLVALGRLRELRLAGNPLCRTMPRYPEFLFLNLPSLKVVDGILREELLQETAVDTTSTARSDMSPQRISHPPYRAEASGQLAVAVEPGKRASERSANAAQPQSSLQLEHLESLLREMELAFAAQERVIAAAVHDPAALVAPPAPTPPLQAPGKAGAAPPQQQPPFATLLTSWRRKMLQAAVLRRTVERDLRMTQSQLVRTRAEMHHKAEALEALLEAQRQRAAILHTENEDLRARMAESELVEAALREKVADCEAKSVRTGNSFQAMRLFLEQYRSQMESSVLQMQQRMLEASQRLRDMEARVQSAAQRVQLGAAVVAQNNVKRRNAAAVASVRSIVAAGAGASSTSVSPQGQGPAGGGGSAEEAWASGLRSLDPEAEAVLRSLFCQMDPADNGFVAAGVLLGCALHPAAGVRDLLRAALDRGCVEFAGADRHARDDGSDYADGEEGEKAKEDAVELSSSSWASNLIVSLQLLVDIRETADLTWGEFLVVLSLSHPDVCTAHSAAWLRTRLVALVQDEGMFCGLSRAEAESLRRGGILGDAEWAMLPLALTIPPSPLLPPLEPSKSLLPQSQHNMHPPPPGSLVPPSWLRTASWGGERSAAGAGVRRSSPSAAPSASDRAVTESVSGEAQGGGASFARMKREALRLARERAFLLARVQEMNRTLERRVEASRGVFATEIRKVKMREEQAKAEALEARREAEAARARISEAVHAQSRARAEAEALKQRVAALEFELAAATAEPAVTSPGAAFVSRQDYDQLLATAEAQTTDLKQRLAKAEAECKLVRRDSCKIEVQMKALQRDLQKLQGLYSAEGAARAEAQDGWDYERGRCAALQQQIAQLQQQIAQLQPEQQAGDNGPGQKQRLEGMKGEAWSGSRRNDSGGGGDSGPGSSASLPHPSATASTTTATTMPPSQSFTGVERASGRGSSSSGSGHTGVGHAGSGGVAGGGLDAVMSKLALFSQRLSSIEQQQ